MISIFLLSFIQGISEFLPVSSSAHLIIFRDLFLIGKDIINSDISLVFDVSLHFGTLLAIIVYFFKDFLNIIKNNNKNIILNIIVATIPAAIIGVLFEDVIENVIRNKYIIISLALIVVGIIIYYVDIKMKEEKSFNNITLKDSLIIGVCQIFALIPGFSRSGTTIIGARLLRINKEDSTKFSFYLSVPILLGAVVLSFFKTDFNIIYSNISIFITGILISFITGILCIKLLLNYIKNNDFRIFMWYRIVLGLIIIIFIFSH